jgi:hypothetical protein
MTTDLVTRLKADADEWATVKSETSDETAALEREAAAEIERQHELLVKAANQLGAHEQPCASYWTTDDDMVEHFDPKQCDCYLRGIVL